MVLLSQRLSFGLMSIGRCVVGYAMTGVMSKDNEYMSIHFTFLFTFMIKITPFFLPFFNFLRFLFLAKVR